MVNEDGTPYVGDRLSPRVLGQRQAGRGQSSPPLYDSRAQAEDYAAWSATRGRLMMQRSVRSVPVVMLDVLAQYDVKVAWSGDQEVVEAFPAQGADEAFGDRLGPGCPDRGA